MKYLFAYLGRRSGGLKKVLSTEEELFEDLDLSSIAPYSASYKLEEEQWFCLEEFSSNNYQNSFISADSPISTVDYHQIQVDEYQKIKYLCYEFDGSKYFQRKYPSNIISQKWISISGEPVLQDNTKILTLHSSPDCIYHIQDDKLYFRDLTKIKGMIKGIEELYREATQEEVVEFFAEEFIELKGGFGPDNVQVANRKRIAQVSDRLSQLDDDGRAYIVDYIHAYCPDIEYDDGKYSIANEVELKSVLFGIDERYYTTGLDSEKRLANSIQKLNT